MASIQETFELAVRHHNAGQIAEAERLFRRIIERDPKHADALHRLGVIALASKRYDVAIEWIGKAIAAAPNRSSYHSNLGNALKEKGELEKAVAAYQVAIGIKPDSADAHYNLGIALMDLGQLDQAVSAFRTSIRIRPGQAEFHNNLGLCLREQGHLEQAEDAFRAAIALKPDFVLAHNNLGSALKEQGKLEEAVAAHRAALSLQPDCAEAYHNLGAALLAQGDLDQAMAAFRSAIQFKPDYGDAYLNLGSILKDQGHLDAAIEADRTAIRIDPHDSRTHSALLFDLQYHPDYGTAAIAAETRNWYQRHAEPLKKFIRPHENDRDSQRRLRIGYVSPDFRSHPVGKFMLPLLEHHTRAEVEIFCYSDVLRADDSTARLRRLANTWRDTWSLTDAQLVESVRRDQIDILVDLAMHSGNNRLLALARKPAPVQVSWLAYPGITGLETIDYRLSDPYMDPPGAGDERDWEKPFRLPQTYWCYPAQGNAPDVNDLPAAETGQITFGCLNNFAKVGPRTVSLWCNLLRQIPNSRLILHNKEGSHRVELIELFAREGIEGARVEFIPRVAAREYIRCYQRIDIALDTFPFGGGTTSCDALWMGVPVVSLIGERPASRAGLSILTNVGLPELAANSCHEYVKIAVDLARDLPRLATLRSEMRQRMQQSPLMDGKRFARDMESAYRTMWRAWCQSTI